MQLIRLSGTSVTCSTPTVHLNTFANEDRPVSADVAMSLDELENMQAQAL